MECAKRRTHVPFVRIKYLLNNFDINEPTIEISKIEKGARKDLERVS